FSDVEKANNDDEKETAEIFRIETNLFDYETPLCTEFKEFNFLLKVDPKLFTHDIERTKTYEDYENELNDELKEPWSEDGVPYEIYYWWKVNDHECSPFYNWRNHIQGPYANYYSNFLDKEEHEDKDKHGLFDDQKRLVCNISRFEMIKYSVGEDEEYIAIKECEYDDLTITNKDAC
ncbi:hypothetical protein Tco_0401479, partial [Tanacetum coccineum]